MKTAQHTFRLLLVMAVIVITYSPMVFADTIKQCIDQPIPSGYVVVATQFASGCPVRFTGDFYNLNVLVSTAGKREIEICSYSPYPPEYYVSSVQYSPSCAPTGPPGFPNTKTIGKPGPSQNLISVCRGSLLPPGWELTGEIGMGTCVFSALYGPPPSLNFKLSAKRISPLSEPTFSLKNSLLPRIDELLTEEFAEFITPLPFAGEQKFFNGSTVNIGNAYMAPEGYPYIMRDRAVELLLLHPGPTGTTSGSSAGFTAKKSAKYSIEGAFARANNYRSAGDGVTVAIYKNQDLVPLFIGAISSNHTIDSDYPFWGDAVAPFDLQVELNEGDIIRFVVFSGPAREASFDVTALTARISARKK